MLPMPRMLTVVLHYGSVAMTRTVVEALRGAKAGGTGGAGSAGAAEGSCGVDVNDGKAYPLGAFNNADEVLVLDNAAPEAYAGALRLPQNVFWGGALDYALHMAQRGNFTHLWFCNNDIRFLQSASPVPIVPRVLGRLIYAQKVLGRPVGIWAPAVSRNPYHPQMVWQEGKEFCTVAYVDGIAPVLNVACVRAIGGLDAADNLRGYGLDVWLALRAHAAGWPVVVDQQVCVRHDYHSTAQAVDGFMAQAAVDEHAYMSARLGPEWRAVVRAKQDILQSY